MTKSTGSRPRWPLFALIAICLIGGGANFLNADLNFRVPSWQEGVAGGVPVLAMVGCVALARRLGTRGAVFSLMPLAGLLVLIEGALRMYFPHANPQHRRLLGIPRMDTAGNEQLFVPHHYSLYSLNPETDTAHGTRHNSLGLRDHREFSPDPSALRIVFIGGSTTYTFAIVNNERMFTTGLERRLSSRYGADLGDRHIEVINAGMAQATSAENLVRLMFFVSELDPDLVVIQHGLNDGWPRAAGGIASDYGNFRKRWSRPPVFPRGRSIAASLALELRFHSMLVSAFLVGPNLVGPVSLTDFVRQPGAHMTLDHLDSSGPQYFARNTRYMVSLARQMGARVMLATIAVSPDWEPVPLRFVAEHNQVMAEIAEDMDTYFFDFAAEMPTDHEYMPDRRHVSQKGSNRKRDLYFDVFVRERIIPDLLGSQQNEADL